MKSYIVKGLKTPTNIKVLWPSGLRRCFAEKRNLFYLVQIPSLVKYFICWISFYIFFSFLSLFLVRYKHIWFQNVSKFTKLVDTNTKLINFHFWIFFFFNYLGYHPLIFFFVKRLLLFRLRYLNLLNPWHIGRVKNVYV